MDSLVIKYNYECQRKSDINEHLPTLRKYAKECESVLELGVRGVVSTWAFTMGLMENSKNTRHIFLNDLNECDISYYLSTTKDLNIDVSYEWIDDLKLEINREYDLTFIDTWHVYGQLKRELDKFSKCTRKYIIMHDTTVDEIYGETIRWMGGRPTAEKQSKSTGIPVDEILKGLWPAIEEFLATHEEWKIKERFTNNNGLTILEKVII